MIKEQSSSNSARTWPGVRAWAISAMASIAVFEFLGVFAWRTQSGRLLDPVMLLIAFPAGAFALMLGAALLVAWLARVPIIRTLNMIGRLMPIAWAVPLIDVIQSYGNGIAVAPAAVSGSGLLLASVTGGLFPLASGLPIGVRFGIFAGALIVAIAVWHIRSSVVRAVAAFLAWSALAVHFTATLSAVLYWRTPFASGAWSADSYSVGHRIIAMLSRGYWWNAIYERFVTSIASQPDVAGSFVTAAIILVVLGILLKLSFLTFADQAKRILMRILLSWGTFDLALSVAIGIAAAIVTHAIPATGGASLLAIFLFLLLMAVLRFGAVMKRDLFRLAADEREGIHQPITLGHISPDDARAFADVSVVFVLASAFVLGWAVFASILAYLAASRLTRERLSGGPPWAPAAYRAIGSGTIAYASLAFASQSANVSVTGLMCVAVAAGYRLFVELFWMPRMKGIDAQAARLRAECASDAKESPREVQQELPSEDREQSS
jgi:hypothetical protein